MKNLENFQNDLIDSKCLVGGEGMETVTNDNGCGGPGTDWYEDGEMYY